MPLVSDYLYRKASVKKIPLGAGFELSPVCNFGCRMCYVRKTPAQIAAEGKRLKHWTQWMKLAEECRKDGTLYILLTGGEPFLYPGFRELYLELHRMGFILSINTNGTMIDKRTLDWMEAASPSRVNVTLYGASPETYRRICGQPSGYEKAVKAILMLKEAGIPVVINASMIPENACDLEKIIAFGIENDINTRVATYMFPPIRREKQENDSRFTPEKAGEMFLRKYRSKFGDACKDMLREQLEEIQKGNETGESWGGDKEYMSCRAGRSSFWVSWDGRMTACGMLPFPVEVYPFERPFHDCWMELTDKVRNTPVLGECSGCGKRKICNPCVAMLYAETGNINRRAPYLCEMADCIIQKMTEEVKAPAANCGISNL